MACSLAPGLPGGTAMEPANASASTRLPWRAMRRSGVAPRKVAPPWRKAKRKQSGCSAASRPRTSAGATSTGSATSPLRAATILVKRPAAISARMPSTSSAKTSGPGRLTSASQMPWGGTGRSASRAARRASASARIAARSKVASKASERKAWLRVRW